MSKECPLTLKKSLESGLHGAICMALNQGVQGSSPWRRIIEKGRKSRRIFAFPGFFLCFRKNIVHNFRAGFGSTSGSEED